MRRVEAVFFEVATLAPVDREAAIRRLCAGDSGMEAEVRSLMASAARLGAFLEQPALGQGVDQLARDSGVAEAPDELIGSMLGAFKVERRIASGGMGSVYLAERNDGQFQLKVAIKVVKRGMDSEEILRRFRAERQTLAALDHPNIARLIDGGITPDGRPFLVMEYVDGLPIDRYCDLKRLKVSQRIALFRQVCDGVHHAHQNLVIHRDIKPSNILVSPLGIPKLLDFGIAKVLTGSTADDAVTIETDRRLTPEYASPEQVEGRPVSTATDVYSLGVVLYELLTGSRPYSFAVRTNEELRRVVCAEMPRSPSNAVAVNASRVRGTAIVRSTTANGTESRGDTGAGPENDASPATDIPKTRGMSSTRLRGLLRGDLDTIVMHALRKEAPRRYVSVEQFSADLGRYLGGMPVQARRDTLAYRASKFLRRHAWSVTLSAAAVLALAGATVMLHQQGKRLAAQRDELVASNRSLEETRQYLVSILGGGETGIQGPDAKLGAVLEEAALALTTDPPADPVTRAAAEQALGRAVMSLGMLDRARPLLESAGRGVASLEVGSKPRVDSEVALAELLFFEGKHSEAEAAFRGLLKAERARSGGVPTDREGLLLNNLGACVRLLGRADEALAIQREALGVRSKVHGARSLPAAESLNNIGTALFQRGDAAGAAESFRSALEIRESLLRQEHPLLVRGRSNLGLVEVRLGHLDDAVALLKASAETWDQAFGPKHPGRVGTITSLAQALRKQGKPGEAVDWLLKSMEWQREHQAAGSPAIAATEANIALALSEAGRRSEALEILERTVPVLTQAGPGFAAITASATDALKSLRGGDEK